MTTETKLYARILGDHLGGMVSMMRQIPEDKWDWTFAMPAPTPRIIATHAWQWLVCDRQHIEEPDAAKHPYVPEPPADFRVLTETLLAEAKAWLALLEALTPEELDAPRAQFNQDPMTVRDFLGHITQHCIYKDGQLATLYFALGLDGDAPYDAPFPNPIYAELHKGHVDAE